MLSRLALATLVLFSAVASLAADDPYARILGVWEYRQANTASPSGFDDEGERLQFTRAGNGIQGLYFGLEREGEHGLFYSLVELTHLRVAGDEISFIVPARHLYAKRPSRIGESLDSSGYTRMSCTIKARLREISCRYAVRAPSHPARTAGSCFAKGSSTFLTHYLLCGSRTMLNMCSEIETTPALLYPVWEARPQAESRE